jgi:hypothetical protein
LADGSINTRQREQEIIARDKVRRAAARSHAVFAVNLPEYSSWDAFGLAEPVRNRQTTAKGIGAPALAAVDRVNPMPDCVLQTFPERIAAEKLELYRNLPEPDAAQVSWLRKCLLPDRETNALTFLGALPLDIHIREQTDSGKPTVVADPDGRIAEIYRRIARRVAVKISEQAKDMSSKFPNIVIQNT